MPTTDSFPLGPAEADSNPPIWNAVDPAVAAPELGERQPSPEPARRTEHARRIAGGISWPSVFWLGAVHIGALAAVWTFTWQGLALMFLLHWITGGIGICMGYHRLFTHSSFETSRPVRWLIALIGSLAGEGPVIAWVADHRKHHALSDQDGDPHSPRDGAWWSHMFWMAFGTGSEEHKAHIARWAPDLQREPMMRFLGYAFLPLQFIFGALLFALGYAMGGSHMGWSFVVWGVFLRLVFVLHSTWFVNSASHLWGYRNYVTSDDSRNSWWVALLTYGEGWHNNHHAYPRMANHGHKWWEFDLTFRTIRLMQWLGLAWNVVDYKHKSERRAA